MSEIDINTFTLHEKIMSRPGIDKPAKRDDVIVKTNS